MRDVCSLVLPIVICISRDVIGFSVINLKTFDDTSINLGANVPPGTMSEPTVSRLLRELDSLLPRCIPAPAENF